MTYRFSRVFRATCAGATLWRGRGLEGAVWGYLCAQLLLNEQEQRAVIICRSKRAKVTRGVVLP